MISEDILETAHMLADAAGPIAREVWFGTGATGYKPDGSALTRADTEIEARLREIVRARHPDHGILGEEEGAEGLDREAVWVIDPIDGTRQFGARLMNFGVLVAFCEAGQPVLGLIDQPLAGARCLGVAGRGTKLNGRPVESRREATLGDAVVALANPRSFGPEEREGYEALAKAGRMHVFDGGCLAYAALARGMVDLCLNGGDLDAIDICALVPVVEGAGGAISDWRGAPLTLASSGAILAAATPGLHARALDLITRTSPVWVP
ncbi:MAG: inositol monophosphatase family protein [Roseovarius sp.]